jgi:hypothetical protein
MPKKVVLLPSITHQNQNTRSSPLLPACPGQVPHALCRPGADGSRPTSSDKELHGCRLVLRHLCMLNEMLMAKTETATTLVCSVLICFCIATTN